jgi:methionyl-tRNA formyltransferase
MMMGTGTFAEPTFRALLESRHPVVGLVTQPDRPVGEARGSTRQTGTGMKTIAEQHHVPVYQPESINTPEGVAKLREWAPDLLVVAAYGQILNNDVLSAAPQGGINVHASLLPKYRGAAPVAWAIYHGEKETGVTIIKMSVHLDAGDMLAQAAMDIQRNETAGELEARLGPLGAWLALRVIDQIEAGTAKGAKQEKAQVTKAPKLKKEDGLIDWARDGWQVCNQIRAMQPWPTAYTFYHREGQTPLRVIVHKARSAVVDDMPAHVGSPRKPGEVVRLPDSGHMLWVWAADNTGVEIEELQPAGKKRMSAADFLRGHPAREGDRFGPETP